MTRLLVTLLLVLSTTACATSKIDREHRDYRDKVAAEYEKGYVKEGTPFFIEEINSDDYRAKFKQSVCSKLSEKECEQREAESFTARLTTVYFAADLEGVFKKCEAYPIECRKRVPFEQWARASHNERLTAWRDGHLKYIDEWRDQAQARKDAESRPDWARIGSALTQFSQTLNSQKKAPQTCQTLPNGMGGFATTCH